MTPTDHNSLFLPMALVLGFRHGLDADHLATIDGLTRFNAQSRPKLSRWAGLLFSLGHGGVVIAIVVLTSCFVDKWQVPDWLHLSGDCISIGFLLLLGMANIAAVCTTQIDQVVPLVSLKSKYLGPIMRAQNPLTILGIGALFALSFDTVSQAAIFGLAVSTGGQAWMSLLLGLAFTTGMIAADSANGLWIARMIDSTHRRARVASRVMGLTLGGTSIFVGLFGLGKVCFSTWDTWAEDKALFFGLFVILLSLLSYVWAIRLTRAPAIKL